jgi:predicted nuclease with RNAse H fold
MLKSVAGVGIDVGADRLHIVGLRADYSLALSAVIDPDDLGALRSVLEGLTSCSVGIDGPSSPSAAPFANDQTVSTKFRNARGCEVVLGREFGIWVSFATGPEPLTGWMKVAAEVHAAAHATRHIALETYPYAVYRLLVGHRPPKKSTAAGISARVDALRARGITEPTLALWSHDALDAAAAALVAVDHSKGIATRAYCPQDDTTIWLPGANPTGR